MGIGARLLIPLRRATLPRRKDKDGAARCEKDHENTESTKRMMKLAGQPLFNVFRFVLSSFRDLPGRSGQDRRNYVTVKRLRDHSRQPSINAG
jgi:hypothetical protein